jgi:hypothetical protein
MSLRDRFWWVRGLIAGVCALAGGQNVEWSRRQRTTAAEDAEARCMGE